MNEVCTQSQDFLNRIFTGVGFNLSATNEESATGCVLNIDGNDATILLNEGGELLEALQHLANQVFGRQLPKGERIVCDVQDFRATREAELKAMARHAAERVRSTGTPFNFAPMNSNERRVIHLALSTEEDLQTESVGEGAARRVMVRRITPST